jgi:hypothetical protein
VRALTESEEDKSSVEAIFVFLLLLGALLGAVSIPIITLEEDQEFTIHFREGLLRTGIGD